VRLVVRPSRYLHYNAGAFVSGGEACLVDPGITADEVAALVEEVGHAEIRYVVLTHADWDHVLGPEHLPSTTIVAHALFADGIDRDGIRAELARLEEHAGIARDTPFEPPAPDETFTDESTLTVGGLELRLVHAPGHSPNMLTIYEPASATLWAADVLSDVEVPAIIDDLGSYERTLSRIAELEIRTLVPGHGNATDDPAEIARRLDEDRTYLAAVREAVTSAVDAGQPLEGAVAAAGAIPLRRSEGDDELNRLNSEKVYADLGGDADPSEVGFARAWKEVTGR
jgi:glyoxylase-like metal-dependent hydrolase (beta-lactamase superfamily II)